MDYQIKLSIVNLENININHKFNIPIEDNEDEIEFLELLNQYVFVKKNLEIVLYIII